MSELLWALGIFIAWVVLAGLAIRLFTGRAREPESPYDPRALETLSVIMGVPMIVSKAAPAEHAYYTIDPGSNRHVLIVGEAVAHRLRAHGYRVRSSPW